VEEIGQAAPLLPFLPREGEARDLLRIILRIEELQGVSVRRAAPVSVRGLALDDLLLRALLREVVEDRAHLLLDEVLVGPDRLSLPPVAPLELEERRLVHVRDHALQVDLLDEPRAEERRLGILDVARERVELAPRLARSLRSARDAALARSGTARAAG